MTPATREREQQTQTETENQDRTPLEQRAEQKQRAAERASTLRTAWENIITRFETYDAESISFEDSKALYIDASVCALLLTIACEDVKADANRRKLLAPYYAAFDRLGLPRLKDALIERLVGNLPQRANSARVEEQLDRFVASLAAAQ